MAVVSAAATGGKHGIVYLYHDRRVSFPVGCRSMDFTFAENNLMDDVFNTENESFAQETRLIENEYSINLPTRFYYKRNGMTDG